MRKPPEGVFARLLDTLVDTYALVLNQDQQITYANAAFLEHFGLKWQEVAGRVCSQLGAPFLTTEAAPMGFCPSEFSPFYPRRTLLTRQVHDKKFIYDAVFYRLLDDGQIAWVVCSFRNVTDRFNLELQVRHLDELERSLVQASMDGIIVNDLLGNVLIFNEGAAKILGYAPEEVVGRLKVFKLYPGKLAHEIKELIYDPANGGVGILENYETMVRHKDGTLIPIWLSARLLYEEGREMGIVGYFRDLRERKRMEEELLRSERLASLGKMVAHISHEIKNPLATIGGFARQLERLPEFSGETHRKLQLIHEEVQRLEKFLADLSTFSRTAPTQKTLGDMITLVREVAELMEPGFKERKVKFRLQAPKQIPPILFDSGQMRQILRNIFKNALEAMSHGGTLTVGVEIQGEQLFLAVTDTGAGIAPEHLPLLFSPFFSTKEEGTGLGLAICRGLIEQHQGEIEVESKVNHGTTCKIRLPLSSS